MIVRASVIVMIARKSGVSVQRPEVEQVLRDGADNTEALRLIMSRKQPDIGRRNFFARLLDAFGLRSA
jgi:hypothetical protein